MEQSLANGQSNSNDSNGGSEVKYVSTNQTSVKNPTDEHESLIGLKSGSTELNCDSSEPKPSASNVQYVSLEKQDFVYSSRREKSEKLECVLTDRPSCSDRKSDLNKVKGHSIQNEPNSSSISELSETVQRKGPSQSNQNESNLSRFLEQPLSDDGRELDQSNHNESIPSRIVDQSVSDQGIEPTQLNQTESNSARIVEPSETVQGIEPSHSNGRRLHTTTRGHSDLLGSFRQLTVSEAFQSEHKYIRYRAAVKLSQKVQVQLLLLRKLEEDVKIRLRRANANGQHFSDSLYIQLYVVSGIKMQFYHYLRHLAEFSADLRMELIHESE